MACTVMAPGSDISSRGTSEGTTSVGLWKSGYVSGAGIRRMGTSGAGTGTRRGQSRMTTMKDQTAAQTCCRKNHATRCIRGRSRSTAARSVDSHSRTRRSRRARSRLSPVRAAVIEVAAPCRNDGAQRRGVSSTSTNAGSRITHGNRSWIN